MNCAPSSYSGAPRLRGDWTSNGAVEVNTELSEVQQTFTRTLKLGEGRMDPDWTAQAMANEVLLRAGECIRRKGEDRSGNSPQSNKQKPVTPIQ